MVQIRHVDCIDTDMEVHMIIWPTYRLTHGSDMAYNVDYER
jgi:hypothetical protein